MEIVQDLKKYAYGASQSFLQSKEDLNQSIAKVATSNNLNSEMIDRICEFANQNVYLNIFNKTQDKSNIQFPKADPNMVKEIVTNSDTTDFNLPPSDFKAAPEISKVRIVAVKAEPETRRYAFGMSPEIQNKQAMLNKLKGLISFLETLIEKEGQKAEQASADVIKTAKAMVADGDSFADIVKLAYRHVSNCEDGIEKVAALFTGVGESLENQGFYLNRELTKISSAPINKEFPLFGTIDSYCDSIDKIAGAQELILNLEKTAKAWKHEILIKVNAPALRVG